MKAKVIKTGEIVNVVPIDGGWCADFGNYARHYSDSELDFSYTDWSSFRREAAKDILAGFAAKIGHPMSDYAEQSCKYAIQLADELIKQLKED